MTAAYRLKGLGWFGGCTAVVLGFYLVSLQVAAERKKVERVDAAIAGAQRDIRALETEFDTRANLAQLERWNGDTLALSAPQAAQFVRDAGQLAAMDPVHRPAAPNVRTAALVVPSAAPAVTMAQATSATPAAQPVAPIRVAAVTPVAPHAQVATVAPRHDASIVRVTARFEERPTIRPAALLRPRTQVALLDRGLLSDATLTQIASGARAERGRLR